MQLWRKEEISNMEFICKSIVRIGLFFYRFSQPGFVVGLVDQKCKKPTTVSSTVTISSLYGTVSAEGGDTSECSSRYSVHLCHVELLQCGAGGGQGKQAGLSHVATASH